MTNAFLNGVWVVLTLALSGGPAMPAAPAAGQASTDKPILVTGTLVGEGGAPAAGTRLNICPEGDPGKPMLMRGAWPVVLGDIQATTDASGSFAFEFYREGPEQLRLGKMRVAVDTRLRVCLVPFGKPSYSWVGPWLDLKTLQKGEPLDLGKVKAESGVP